MRRLVSKEQKRFVEIRLEDQELLATLKTMMELLLSDSYLEDFALPVVEKVVAQINDPNQRKPGGHHLLLELEQSVIFFKILVELDDADKQMAEQYDSGQRTQQLQQDAAQAQNEAAMQQAREQAQQEYMQQTGNSLPDNTIGAPTQKAQQNSQMFETPAQLEKEQPNQEKDSNLPPSQSDGFTGS